MHGYLHAICCCRARGQEDDIQVVQEGVVRGPQVGLGQWQGEALPHKASGGGHWVPCRAGVHHHLHQSLVFSHQSLVM